MKNRALSLLLLLVLSVGCCHASIWDDLNAIRAKYNGIKSYAADHVYTLTADDPADRVVSVQYGSMAYSPAGYRYLLGDNLFAANQHYVWGVYKDVAEMVVQPLEEEDLAAPEGIWNFKKFDALLQQYKVLSAIPASKVGHRALRFDFHAHPLLQYRLIEMEYDPSTYAVLKVKMVYQYEASYYGLQEDYIPVLTIEYSHQQFNPDLAASSFSEAGYFKLAGDHFVGISPAYRDFTILTPYE